MESRRSTVGLVATALLALTLTAHGANAASGILTTDFAGDTDRAQAAIAYSSSKLVAAGFAFTPGSTDFAVARYLMADGSLDPLFGGGGKVTTDFAGGTDVAYAVLGYRDRVVAAGFAGLPNGGQTAVARYLSNGQLDTTFNGTGTVTTDFGDNEQEYHALGYLKQGRIVAAGYSGNLFAPNSHDFAVGVYDKSGAVVWKEKIGFFRRASIWQPTDDFAKALAVQKDGRIVVGGDAVHGVICQSTTDFALVRLNDDGTVDPTFGGGGQVMTDLGGVDEINALGIQKDGKIVAAGFTSTACGGPTQFALVRYDVGGTPDPTFGVGGVVTHDFVPAIRQFGTALKIQSDGKIVVAGYTQPLAGWSDFNMMVARYLPTGDPDPTFGQQGFVLVHTGGPFDYSDAEAVVIARSHSIFPVGVFAGQFAVPQDFMIAKLDATGVLDPFFGQ